MLKANYLLGLIATALLLVVNSSHSSQFIGSVEAFAESGKFTTTSIKNNPNEDFYIKQVSQSYLAQAGEQSSWTKVPGGARDIGIGGDRSVWVVGASENNEGNSVVYRRKDSEWEAMNGYGISIDVAPGGTPWIFNRQGEIFYLNLNNNQWIKVPGQARGIGIGGDGSVWVLGWAAQDKGYPVYQLRRSGSEWRWEQALGGVGVAIDVAPGGTPWIIDKQGAISYLDLNNNQWIKVPGRARQIGIGGDRSVWVVGWDFNSEKAGYPIYRRKGSDWEFANAYGVAIDVAPGGTPWIANQRGEIFYSVSAQPLPDLKITDISVTPKPITTPGQIATLISGTTYSFKVQVANVGQGSVPGNVSVSFDYGCIQECEAVILGQPGLQAFVGQVGVGETKWSNPVSIKPGGRGIYNFRFMVDLDNIYQESDESPSSNVWETKMNVQ